MTALCRTTLSCYEGFKPNSLVPTSNAWGSDNRTVAFRVKNKSPGGNYIENRIPSASSNPYLVTIGSLIAGMDGIKRNLQPKSDPYKGNIYKAKEMPIGIESLPETFENALQNLQEDELFVRELGDGFIKAFVACKKNEIEK